MGRPRKVTLEEALDKLNNSKVSRDMHTSNKKIEWLMQEGFPKRHAVPKGRGISLCGRGGDRPWDRDIYDLPKCKKCLFLMKHKSAKKARPY